jgi:hypothetical protein
MDTRRDASARPRRVPALEESCMKPMVRAARAARRVVVLWLAIAPCALHGSRALAEDPFADAVAAYTPGINGGFGADELPDIVLGPPVGGGTRQGSLDVLALGSGGSITLQFDLPVICDGPGDDFTVFENAFHSGSPNGPLFIEYAYVAVSQDGEHFFEMPYDADTGVGLAGRTPVLSTPDNGISPLDPAVSGGDAFDLAAVGLAWASYVRITDVAGAIPDFGDLPQFSVAPNAGADIDAVAAVHACDPGMQSSATPTPSATPSRTAAVGATATASATAGEATATPIAEGSATPAASPSATAISVPGDVDGDGRVTAADIDWLIAELFDGDGDSAASVAGGDVAFGPAVDVNGDGRITAADLAALRALELR